MSKILAMFPGQGSQCRGMSQGLFEKFPEISNETFDKASKAAGFSIKRLCLKGSTAELMKTSNAQPSILTVSVAAWRVIKESTGIEPAFFAGHSLGEYSALVAAGILDFAQAVRLVVKRGEAMERAVPNGVGTMAAVIKCPLDVLMEQCRAVSSGVNHYVQIANYNALNQHVVAGHVKAVDELCDRLDKLSCSILPLPVGGPFHSMLMSSARDEMTPLLEEATFINNGARIIANVTGEVVDNYGPRYLIKQIDSPVFWLQGLQTAQKLGIDVYLDVGPKSVLSNLARGPVVKGAKKIAAWEDIRAAIEALNSL